MMTNNKISLKDYTKSIQMVFFAMLLGQIFFAVVSYFLVAIEKMEFGKLDFQEILTYILPIFIIITMILSQVTFQNRLAAVKECTDLSSKLINYRAALIIRWALLEGPSFLSIIVFLLTGNYFILSLAALLVVAFAVIIPTQNRIETDLELNWQDKAEMGE